MTVPGLLLACCQSLTRNLCSNPTASKFFHGGSLGSGGFRLLTRTSWFNPTACEAFRNGSLGFLLGWFQLLTRTSWFNPTASGFFHGDSPGVPYFLLATNDEPMV